MWPFRFWSRLGESMNLVWHFSRDLHRCLEAPQRITKKRNFNERQRGYGLPNHALAGASG